MNRNNIRFIGLTGGIGTGKSTCTSYLKHLGYPVIDADNISRELVSPGTLAYTEIVNYFGELILNADQTIDRRSLGKIVFASSEQRAVLNDIMHPKVREEINKQFNVLSQTNTVIFADIPLLFESEMQDMFDVVWLIYAPEIMMINRIIERDNLSADEAILRIRSQINIEIKKEMASTILNNTGTKNELYYEIDKALIHLDA